MQRHFVCVVALGLAVLFVAGCGNPVKRKPANVFPGSAAYEERVSEFKITPAQAYTIAHEAAQTDNKLQFLSRRPTVITKRWYVFSMPQPTGATLQGYHVNGDNGEVKFHGENTRVENKK